MNRDDLFTALDAFLDAPRFRDYCPNGLQLEGRAEVQRVALGVSVSAALIEHALSWSADLLLVHHGLFWRGTPQVVRGYRRARLKVALAADLNIGAYHLPLDGHPEVGNNILLARALGLTQPRWFGESGGVDIGVIGTLPQPLPPQDVRNRIAAICGGEPLAFLHGPALVQKVGIISGGAGRMVEDAIDQGVDLFLTGEAEEPTMALTAEASVHFVAAGHYRTETFGIRALGEHLRATWGLETRFFDLPNPV